MISNLLGRESIAQSTHLIRPSKKDGEPVKTWKAFEETSTPEEDSDLSDGGLSDGELSDKESDIQKYNPTKPFKSRRIGSGRPSPVKRKQKVRPSRGVSSEDEPFNIYKQQSFADKLNAIATESLG